MKGEREKEVVAAVDFSFGSFLFVNKLKNVDKI